MNAAALWTGDVPAPEVPRGLEQRRIERALRARSRYRYVQPEVLSEGSGWRVRAPCCSRRVDPDGGLIDIAWLERVDTHRWRLHARLHKAQCWRAVDDGSLPQLLERLAADPLHEFWI